MSVRVGLVRYLTDSNLIVTGSSYEHKITSLGCRCLAAYSAISPRSVTATGFSCPLPLRHPEDHMRAGIWLAGARGSVAVTTVVARCPHLVRRDRGQGHHARTARPVTAAKTSGHRIASGGTSLSISSHRSRHWPQIRVGPADAMAPARSRPFPQKQHRSVPASSATGSIVPIRVLATWPGSAITRCARGTHWSQMKCGAGTPIITLACSLVCPQNEHTICPPSGTHSMYPCGGISHRCRTLVRS